MALNKVILIGRLANEPESGMINDVENTTFRLAVSRSYTTKGKDKPETDFIPVSLWRANAKFASNYYTQGCRVYVVGSLENYTREGENGTVYSYKINGIETGFAGGKKSDRNEKKDNTQDIKQNAENAGFAFIPGEFDDDLLF